MHDIPPQHQQALETVTAHLQLTDPAARDAAAMLRKAWDGMLEQLVDARNAIDDPKLWPPPATPRNLAEGYRYVLGFLYGSISRGARRSICGRFRSLRWSISTWVTSSQPKRCGWNWRPITW